MAYVINKSDGTAFVTLEDATVDNSTSITLVGRNYVGYGEAQNENFLFLLENFAHEIAPVKPIIGQLWYDKTLSVIKVYDGTNWVALGAATYSADAPSNPGTGSFWFKSSSNVLYTYNGTDWVLVGPETAEGFATTRAVSTTLFSSTGINHAVIQLTVDGTVVGIISNATFTINSSNPVAGFSDLEAGLNISSGMFLNGNVKGNSSTATVLENLRTINGVGFNGSQDITIKASTTNKLESGDYITGSDFDGSSNTVWSVNASSNNGIGTIVARDSGGDFAAGTITADLIGDVTGNVTATSGTSRFNTVEANTFIGQQLTGNAFSSTKLRTPRNINGVAFDGTADITVTASARTLTDTALPNTVVNSNLSTVGTLTSLSVLGNITVNSNLTVSSSGTQSELTGIRNLILTADDGTDTASARVIAPDVSVLAGTGANGGLVPSTDGDVDLGKTNLKWDNVHGNLFVGDLQGNADTATLATTATNIAGGARGSIPYQTAAGTTALLPAGTPGQVLQTRGTSGDPVWGSAAFATLEPGAYITGEIYKGDQYRSWSVDATPADVGATVVARDTAGDFSAGTITASLSGNADTATRLQTARTINGVSFDGTGNITITATDPNKVPLSGGTMTGRLTLSANPTTNLHAATKQYVDSQVLGLTVYYGSATAVGYTNQVGSWNNGSNYFDVFPPSGKTMSNLVGFIPSIKRVYYAGGVDGNDQIRCEYEERSDRIRVWVQNSEQRAKPRGNFLSIWN